VPSYYIRADINIDRSRAEDLLIRGLSSGEGRRVVISTIRQAKLNREL
jgi:uncharacterized protein YoaH (UPF0181 family)